MLLLCVLLRWMFQVLYIYIHVPLAIVLCSSYVLPGKSKHDDNSTKTGVFWWPGCFEWSLGLLSEGEAAEHKTTKGSRYVECSSQFPGDPIAHQSWEHFLIEATYTSWVSFRWLFTPNHYHSQTIPEVWMTPWIFTWMPTIRIWEKGSSFKGNFRKHPAQKYQGCE